MKEAWRFMTWLKLCRMVMFVVVVSLFPLSMKHAQCSTLNSEGLALQRMKERVVRDPSGALSSWNGEEGVIDPCLWFGVECFNGNVVTLDLKDLCLHGTLAPEIGKLVHIKSIILRNNSFFGDIPKEILQLEELEVLDLGYNNFSGSFPSDDLGNNLSLTTLLLDNNDYLVNLTPEVYNLKMISELHVHEEQLTGVAPTREACILLSACDRHIGQHGDIVAHMRQLLQVENAANSPKTKKDDNKETISPSPSSFPTSLSPVSEPFSPSPSIVSPSESPSNSPTTSFFPSPLRSPIVSPSPSPSPSSIFFTFPPSPSPVVAPTPDITSPANPPTIASTPSHSPASSSNQGNSNSSNPKHHSVIIWSTVGSFSFLILVSAIFLCFRNNKVVTVKPWATGLSGQLQRAFVTGVPSLKRAELEAACEDFSNIIGSQPEGTVYKGTLSSGVEIAVASSAVTSSQNWSKDMEAQFRKKIEVLSRVNHKNFVNLIGYCEEKKPFTRMMVFEYAPNGTLFEHLHIREAEQLDWVMRMRIAMGIAYCLEHLHQLTPPIAHRNLLSSSIYLTEDYAAKLSDLSFWDDIVAAKKGSEATQLLETTSAYIEGNVYSFGVILFELITGRIPYAVDNGFLFDWAAEYIRGQPLRDLVDTSLNSLQAHEIDKWSEVINNCVHPDPEKRPTMREVTAKLKEITAMEPDGAAPKSSPLWWAELEIMSTDLSSDMNP
ncbi:inactive receptor-like serine/threonine-protein kinase At2g40270 [Gastrolobium bilobum]|uniref:inactive receptor-like serine/threonine-protein kinase At2g40270 n=1 Tax=Gastrolobium bilobum TaxID=150636 RepID=UPI002AAF3960|nr:inactive receptor-like serine/threonine-protein kinase At2g40270 [Gastrolobium bilobum]